MPRIKKTLIDAALIKVCRELGFREFSQDARYLEIHYLDDIIHALGSPSDDFENFFTARMLLLLEGEWVFNELLYKDIIERLISTYYRDYHDHEQTFRPIFLVNDIIRFWKTLCLNYEHGRNQLLDETRKNKNHLRNLKLKYSRLLTCFSTILVLSKNRHIFTPKQLFALIVGKTPLDRIMDVAGGATNGQEILEKILEEYIWFLDVTGREEPEVLDWISDRKNRDKAFERARQFGSLVYELLTSVGKETDTLRYLTI